MGRFLANVSIKGQESFVVSIRKYTYTSHGLPTPARVQMDSSDTDRVELLKLMTSLWGEVLEMLKYLNKTCS